MSLQSFAGPMLVHPGTGRSAAIVCSEDFSGLKPVYLGGRRYVLLIVNSRPGTSVPVDVARRWIDSGASYVCVWGPASHQLEEDFDYASFAPDCGGPLAFTLMTTAHGTEALSETLWFAFYNATPPDDLNAELDCVVIVVDSENAAEECELWVKENAE